MAAVRIRCDAVKTGATWSGKGRNLPSLFPEVSSKFIKVMFPIFDLHTSVTRDQRQERQQTRAGDMPWFLNQHRLTLHPFIVHP